MENPKQRKLPFKPVEELLVYNLGQGCPIKAVLRIFEENS